jgi:hypothetical protein
VVVNTHPLLSLVCQQLPHPLLVLSPSTPHRSSYNFFIDDINNTTHPRLAQIPLLTPLKSCQTVSLTGRVSRNKKIENWFELLKIALKVSLFIPSWLLIQLRPVYISYILRFCPQVATVLYRQESNLVMLSSPVTKIMYRFIWRTAVDE